MHFHKYPYVANFEFAKGVSPQRSVKTRRGSHRLTARAAADDLYHIKITGKGWETNDSQTGLSFPKAQKDLSGQITKLVFGDNGQVRIEDLGGKVLITSAPNRFFGQSGAASLFEFVREEGDQYYGMGEKWTGLEHSGKMTKFWNTDVWADFHPESYIQGRPGPDPVYLSIPYLILKRGDTWIGFLLDNPRATFISTGVRISIADQMEVTPGGNEFAEQVIGGVEAVEKQKKFHAPHGFIHLGAEEGQPNLYILVGPSLPELTRKLQTLIGTTPRPPAWALGYQQCRWGYKSEADLLSLDRNFRKHGIPVDGLWLDIDYMRGYRVFTFDKKHFPKPSQAMAKLLKAGRKVVPIIDPGVKWERGYEVYERGHAAQAFCQNPQGGEFVGLVWPGQTVFPDFSLPSARKWWAKEIADFARLGIHGAWLDMNDPATGIADNVDMLFDKGRKIHSTFHNQYALGMARASYEGFLEAFPDQRPFLLSRSGFTGSNRYTAIWTGDNFSNYHHLKNSIPTTLNLALSGQPFNGPDVGGFGGDTTPELLCDWYKAGFLFPIFRNHSIINSQQQEPWIFGPKALKIARRFIQLRYRLRPYLYQLFIEQEETGEAILRPLFYDFKETRKQPLGLIDDQFLVGPSILQAPFVVEKQKSRDVVLPGTVRWYDTASGKWLKGGQTIKATAKSDHTPLYIRDASILPLARLAPADHVFESGKVDFHIFLAGNGTAQTRYVFDDGISYSYRKGKFSELEITARRSGTAISVTTRLKKDAYGQGDFTFTTEPSIRTVTINGQAAKACAAQGISLGATRKSWKLPG